MNIYDFPPIAAALDAAHTAVTTLADLLTPLAGVHATALAIVVCALLIRVALIPVGVSTARADADRRRLAPSIHRIREKYGTNPELLRRKTMELYTAEKVSPLAGCLPLLVQAPIVSVVYGLFVTPRINGHANELLAAPLLDVPLGSTLPGLVTAGAWWPDVAVVAVLLAVIAVVSALSRRVALRWAAQNPAPAAPAATPRSPGSPGSPAMPVIPAGTLAMLSWLPFLTVVFAAIVPLAATLYLTVTTAWTLAERVLLRRRFDRLAAARASSQP